MFLQAFLDSLTGRLGSLEPNVRALEEPLRIFLLSCGDCNGCNLEVAALQGAAYDGQAKGILFVNHPVGADILMITGLLNRSMISYVQRSWELMRSPKAIVVVGNCTINNHVFKENYAIFKENVGGEDCVLYIEGCPPTPQYIMEQLMTLKKDQDRFQSVSGFHHESSEHLPSASENCDSLKEAAQDTADPIMPTSPKDQPLEESHKYRSLEKEA